MKILVVLLTVVGLVARLCLTIYQLWMRNWRRYFRIRMVRKIVPHRLDCLNVRGSIDHIRQFTGTLEANAEYGVVSKIE